MEYLKTIIEILSPKITGSITIWHITFIIVLFLQGKKLLEAVTSATGSVFDLFKSRSLKRLEVEEKEERDKLRQEELKKVANDTEMKTLLYNLIDYVKENNNDRKMEYKILLRDSSCIKEAVSIIHAKQRG